MEPNPGDLDWETPDHHARRSFNPSYARVALLPGPWGVGGGGKPRSQEGALACNGEYLRGWVEGDVLLIISSPCSPVAPASVSLPSWQFSAQRSKPPFPEAVYPSTPTLSLGGLEQAGRFDHLAPCPAPRCLRTPSIGSPFPAPLASPSSSVLCSRLSSVPPSLLPLSSSLPPASLAPSQPAFFPSFSALLLVGSQVAVAVPSLSTHLGLLTGGFSGAGAEWNAARGWQKGSNYRNALPFPPSVLLLSFLPLLSSIPQAAKEGAWRPLQI